MKEGKGCKVLDIQEPPAEESVPPVLRGRLSTAFSNATEVSIKEIPSCSRPQPATYNDVRDGRSNLLVITSNNF